MSRPKIIYIGLLLICLLVGISIWKKHVELANSTAVQNKVVSLMPYSTDWKLSQNEEAMLVLVYLPGTEITEEQLRQLEETAPTYSGKVKFASLNLTIEHPSYTNTAYATVYGVKQSPTYILQRRGESAYHKHSGPMTSAELKNFIDTGLVNKPVQP